MMNLVQYQLLMLKQDYRHYSQCHSSIHQGHDDHKVNADREKKKKRTSIDLFQYEKVNR